MIIEMIIAPHIDGQPLADYVPPGTIAKKNVLEEKEEELKDDEEEDESNPRLKQ